MLFISEKNLVYNSVLTLGDGEKPQQLCLPDTLKLVSATTEFRVPSLLELRSFKKKFIAKNLDPDPSRSRFLVDSDPTPAQTNWLGFPLYSNLGIPTIPLGYTRDPDPALLKSGSDHIKNIDPTFNHIIRPRKRIIIYICPTSIIQYMLNAQEPSTL